MFNIFNLLFYLMFYKIAKKKKKKKKKKKIIKIKLLLKRARLHGLQLKIKTMNQSLLYDDESSD